MHQFQARLTLARGVLNRDDCFRRTRSILGDFPSFKEWHAQRPELYSWVAKQTVQLVSWQAVTYSRTA